MALGITFGAWRLALRSVSLNFDKCEFLVLIRF